jgi:hypothetical protein
MKATNTKAQINTGATVRHPVYGKGEVKATLGLFTRVKFARGPFESDGPTTLTVGTGALTVEE